MRFDGSAAPAWRARLGLGPVTHGLEVLGARTPEELQRMGWDVIWSPGMPADADPICDVNTARVFFPKPPPVRVALTVDAGDALGTLADLDWSVRWLMFLAAQRRAGIIEVRRQADQARARLGLLRGEEEESLVDAGGAVRGAYGWSRLGRLVARGDAAAGRFLLLPPLQVQRLAAVARGRTDVRGSGDRG